MAKRTQTKTFGSGNREGHDSSSFYSRFEQMHETNDNEISPQPELEEKVICGDSRNMKEISDRCVALVVTSPPYFVGKEYEIAETNKTAPETYPEYLEMLGKVFSECMRVLEPGGRIAVNAANLGRKPYRSLSADLINILENIGFLMRGEIIWQKSEGAGGSCAWGSFMSASNPVLRDTTERVIVASKGQFARALRREDRKSIGLPYEDSMTSEEFMCNTLDVWKIQPESAKRIGHPAPFPVELPYRLINLYTYKKDLVLDPFMGSGGTLVAAKKAERNYIGYDIVEEYVTLAKKRLEGVDKPARAFNS